MKRFAYACVGILALTIAHEIGARGARADVDPTNPGPVLLVGPYSWAADGSCWIFGPIHDQWTRVGERDLPIPPSDVAMIGGGSSIYLATHNGQCWKYENAWVEMLPFPGGPVSIDHKS